MQSIILTLVAFIMLMGQDAKASKARLQALGQNPDRGSGYVNDYRNVFKNPAVLAGMDNLVTTEWNDTSKTTTASAEGGFFHNVEPFAFGIYLGSDLYSQNRIRSGRGQGYAGSDIDFGGQGMIPRENEIDLFLAGDMGAKWGIRLGYAKSAWQTDSTPKATHTGLDLSAGTLIENLSLYGHLVLSDESKGNRDVDGDGAFDSVDLQSKWEGHGFEIGARYTMNDFRLTFNYRNHGADFVPVPGQVKNTTEQEAISFGVAHVTELSNSSMMFIAGSYVVRTSKDKDGEDVSMNRKKDEMLLPVKMGLEVYAKEWLALQGSITQNVFFNSSKTKNAGITYDNTAPDTTTVEAGMGLVFDKLRIDSAIGTGGVGRLALHYMF